MAVGSPGVAEVSGCFVCMPFFTRSVRTSQTGNSGDTEISMRPSRAPSDASSDGLEIVGSRLQARIEKKFERLQRLQQGQSGIH